MYKIEQPITPKIRVQDLENQSFKTSTKRHNSKIIFYLKQANSLDTEETRQNYESSPTSSLTKLVG